MELRPYQIKAISSIYGKYAAGCRRLVLVAPTGSGKTAMASRIAYDAAIKRGRRVLVMAHRSELLDQLSGSLAAWGVPHGVITEGWASDPSMRCQVASIQTLEASAATIPRMDENDLVIIDECHIRWAVGVLGSLQQCRWLGLTATPYYNDAGRLHQLPEYSDFVMAATPRELERDGYIVPLRIWAPPLPEGLLVDSDDLPVRERVMGQATVMGKCVETWQRAGQVSTLVYGVSVDHAVRLAEMFQKAGIDARSISGYDAVDRRRDTIESFRRAEFPVLCNAMLLTEGLDVPHVRRIVMMRPTDSLAVFLQQVGRSVRPLDGKDFAQIYDHAGNILTHGHPYEERVIAVGGTDPVGHIKDNRGDDAGGLWRCTHCFFVAVSAPDHCPSCGTIVKRKGRRVSIRGGEVVEYDLEQIARLAADKERNDSARAENNLRIKQLFGVFLQTGISSISARRYVFAEYAKWPAARARGVPWDEFKAEVRSRVSKR